MWTCETMKILECPKYNKQKTVETVGVLTDRAVFARESRVAVTRVALHAVHACAVDASVVAAVVDICLTTRGNSYVTSGLSIHQR